MGRIIKIDKEGNEFHLARYADYQSVEEAFVALYKGDYRFRLLINNVLKKSERAFESKINDKENQKYLRGFLESLNIEYKDNKND